MGFPIAMIPIILSQTAKRRKLEDEEEEKRKKKIKEQEAKDSEYTIEVKDGWFVKQFKSGAIERIEPIKK